MSKICVWPIIFLSKICSPRPEGELNAKTLRARRFYKNGRSLSSKFTDNEPSLQKRRNVARSSTSYQTGNNCVESRSSCARCKV